MRTLIGLFALLVVTVPGAAQETPPASKGLVIGGDTPVHENCVEVQIGNAKAYDCLNMRLKRQVERINPLPNIPPIDAKSPDVKLGIVNMPAVRQQYGKNFGVSAIPYRPAPRVYSGPLGQR